MVLMLTIYLEAFMDLEMDVKSIEESREGNNRLLRTR